MKEEKKFVPKKKASFEKELEELLLEGKIIRYCCDDAKPLEIVGREHIGRMPDTGNIGQEEDIVEKKIHCSWRVLVSVVSSLEREYSVRRVRCSNSGCCQYATCAYYVDD